MIIKIFDVFSKVLYKCICTKFGVRIAALRVERGSGSSHSHQSPVSCRLQDALGRQPFHRRRPKWWCRWAPCSEKQPLLLLNFQHGAHYCNCLLGIHTSKENNPLLFNFRFYFPQLSLLFYLIFFKFYIDFQVCTL